MKTSILYNGSCPICSREISAYMRYAAKHDLPLEFEDLGQTDLNRWGITPDQAAKRIHVLHNGQVISGIPAFALVWDKMAHMKWLARLVRLPVISTMANALYDYILAPALFALHKRRQSRRNTCT